MEMHQVRYFLAVCEHLNVTRAAEACNVSQPAMTRAIKQLEEELGGLLFHRERNQTHLTDLGREMQPYLTEVLNQTEAAKQRARGMAKLEATPLSLGIMCSIGPSRLIDFVRRFQDANPGIDMTIRDGRAQLLQDALIAGEIDVALFGLPGPVDDRLQGRPLFEERFLITFAPGHRFEAMNAVPLAELNDERYLSRASCEFGEFMSGLLAERGFGVRRCYRSERDDWIQAMVAAGLGFGFTPEFAVTVPGVLGRPLVEPEVKRVLNVVTVRGRPHTPAVAALMKAAVTYRWI